MVFPLTEENLDNYLDFIDAIRKQKDELVQYSEKLSLFTDFFIRSYINACQLYCREIFFEPEITVPGLQNFRIRKIDKPQGTGIAKGDPGITMF